jgi:hypothetical protein
LRTRIAAIVTAVALGIAVPAAQPLAQPSKTPAVAVAAHKCKSGYKHGIIGGEHKCLRRGQYCAKRYRKQYRKYGYRCVKDSRGVYRLR